MIILTDKGSWSLESEFKKLKCYLIWTILSTPKWAFGFGKSNFRYPCLERVTFGMTVVRLYVHRTVSTNIPVN